jgi:hypothetical protein
MRTCFTTELGSPSLATALAAVPGCVVWADSCADARNVQAEASTRPRNKAFADLFSCVCMLSSWFRFVEIQTARNFRCDVLLGKRVLIRGDSTSAYLNTGLTRSTVQQRRRRNRLAV